MTNVTQQASDSLTLLEAKIAAAGHQLERTFEGAVANAPASDDPGWWGESGSPQGTRPA